MSRRYWFFAAMLSTLLLAGADVMAQNQGQNQNQNQGQNQGGNNGGFNGGQGNNGGFGRGGRGGRGNFDPAQRLQFQLDNIKQTLEAKDDEWQVLLPKVQRVLIAEQEASAGRGGGRRGGGGGGGFNNNNGGGGGGGGARGPGADTAVGRAMAELRDLLNNPASTGQQITDKLAQLRAARTRAETELVAAQKELKELLTPKQEGILVSMGTLQ